MACNRSLLCSFFFFLKKKKKESVSCVVDEKSLLASLIVFATQYIVGGFDLLMVGKYQTKSGDLGHLFHGSPGKLRFSEPRKH